MWLILNEFEQVRSEFDQFCNNRVGHCPGKQSVLNDAIYAQEFSSLEFFVFDT